MRANKIETGPRKAIVAVALVALALVATGAVVGFIRLRDVYLEQCVIRDMSAQVSITSGKMVHPATIAEELGLRVGANLATIDFPQKRKEILAKIPNLRTIRISRHLPDKVTVTAEERTPIARIGLKGKHGTSGRVVDSEGMVFICQRGTQSLPIIREATPPGPLKGQRVTGRTVAALRLIEACREPALMELGVLEVDTSKHDFLVVTLGNYSKAQILWTDMDESTPIANADMLARLTNLRKAIRNNLTSGTVIWNATLPDRVFANMQESL